VAIEGVWCFNQFPQNLCWQVKIDARKKGVKERLISFHESQKRNNIKESTMRTMKARKAMYFVALMVAVVALLVSSVPLRASSPEPDLATAGTTSKTDRVEARIKELYTKLKITPAQEELWNNVTQVMRDNAKTMEALIKARSEKAGTMTAVDDLKSYGEIADAHADGIKKFIPVFEPLYASMSDVQKKNADTFFRHHGPTKSKTKGR
jgi:protein CpxP